MCRQIVTFLFDSIDTKLDRIGGQFAYVVLDHVHRRKDLAKSSRALMFPNRLSPPTCSVNWRNAITVSSEKAASRSVR